MKHTYLLGALLALHLPVASAVDLNKDALKSIQEEGHKMIAEEEGLHSFKSSSGLCLHGPNKNGGQLKVGKCDGKSNAQRWKLDDKGHLVNMEGKCVGVAGSKAVLNNCSGGKSEKWKLDGKKRLANGDKKCLQAAEGSKSSGGAVTAAACGGAANQVWK